MYMAKQSTTNGTAQISLGMACEQGGRSNLEDRVAARHLTTATGLSLTVAMVADGVGGSKYGEIAAELAIHTVFEEIEASDLTDPNGLPELLQRALEKANDVVYQKGRTEKEKRGMGSTAVLAAVHNNQLYLANVGDSRAYLVRGPKGEQVQQLTQDHTWAWEMVTSKRLAAAEAAGHPKAEELVRSIGYAAEVKVDLGLYQNRDDTEASARQWQGFPLQANDRVLLCSDGLIKARHNGNLPYVTEAEIAQVVTRHAPEKAASALVQKAISRQADDNVSAVVLEMPGSKRVFYIPPIVVYVSIGLLALLLIVSLIIALSGRSPDPLPTRATEAEIPQVAAAVESTPTQQLRPTQPGGEILLSLTGPTQHTFPDGTQLLLNNDATVDVLAQAGENGAIDNQVLLKHGSMVVAATGTAVIISNSYGARAEIENGLLGVSHDEAIFQFSAACLRGQCRLFGDLEGMVSLAQGQGSFVGGSGRPAQPAEADYALYYAFAPDIVPAPTTTSTPTETATPTETPTPTITPRPPTSTPTATATEVPATETPTPEPPPPPPPQPTTPQREN
jgi:serine/threonine protein phosphatase PrpC